MPALTTATNLLPAPLRQQVRSRVIARRHRGLKPPDALIVSYPKSGSTWLRMILSTALSGSVATFDSVRQTMPPLGALTAGVPLLRSGGMLVRSHEPLKEIYKPFGRPIIYIVRDGRDVAVSLFHHIHRFSPAPLQRKAGTDINTYIPKFLDGVGTNYGSWAEHVRLAQRAQVDHADDVLMVRYEDALEQPVKQLHRIMCHLGERVEVSDLEDAVGKHTKAKIRESEKNAQILSGRQGFVRNARPGDWRNELSEESAALLQAALAQELRAFGYGTG